MLPIMSLRSSFSHLQTQVHLRPQKFHPLCGSNWSPTAQVQKRKGVECGPVTVREAGLMKKLSNLECHRKDFGDLSFTAVVKDDLYNNLTVNLHPVGLANQELAKVVCRAVSSGYSSVTVGGDHSLAIDTISGHAWHYPDLCVTWVDAHADVGAPLTTSPGCLSPWTAGFISP